MNRFVIAPALFFLVGLGCGTKSSSEKSPCPTGQSQCGSKCVDLTTDVDNCGVCSNACTAPNGAPVCRDGSCNIASCDTIKPGVDGGCNPVVYLDCDAMESNGCEVNPQTDPNNCGGCGNACFFANAAASCSPGTMPGVCTTGSCVMGACSTGFADCNMNPADGCETDTQTDVANCGSCGHACPGANATCAAGQCG